MGLGFRVSTMHRRKPHSPSLSIAGPQVINDSGEREKINLPVWELVKPVSMKSSNADLRTGPFKGTESELPWEGDGMV